MALTTAMSLTKLLDKRIDDIFLNDYAYYSTEFDKIAKISTAPKGDGGGFRQAEISGLGPMREISEGGQVTYDDAEEGNEVNRTPTKYGLGFQVTEEMVRDDHFDKIMQMPKELSKSAAYKRETVFWDLFNNGFATHTSWDGEYIFDNAVHTALKTGDAIDNAPAVSGSLSETTLQAAFEYFDTSLDSSGIPITLIPRILVIPTKLQWAAAALLKTDKKVTSMDNDINTIKDRGGLVIFISRHLTSDTAFFVLSDDHDFNFKWYDDITLQSSDDFSTGNALYKATCRFSAFCNNFIGAYGNAGA